MTKNKTTAIAIAIFLTLSMSASMMLVPTASAHTPPYQITIYAKVVALPDPIGVGQSGLIYAFLANAPLTGSTIENTFRNHNYTVTVTSPNGTNQVFHYDTVTDTTGVQFIRFTPTDVGQYNITFVYGGNVLNSTYFDTTTAASVGDIWLPSTATCTLTVQQEPVTSYPDSYPLPTDFWTRPIYGENSYWFSISSNWFGQGSPCLSDLSYGTVGSMPSGSGIQRYPGDAVGSLTSHVMWTKALQEGGVVGGNRTLTQGDTYFEGSAYNQRYANPIIMYGRLFYREGVSYPTSMGSVSGDSVCVDLVTGQEIWRRTDLPTISYGFTFDVQSPNQHGMYPAFLCTSNFAQVYDMWTGISVFNVTGSASGFSVLGPQGEWLKYNIYSNATNGYFLTIWNSSLMFTGEGFLPGTTGLSPAADTNTYHPTGLTTWTNTTIYVNNVAQVQSVSTTSPTVTAVNATLSKRYVTLNATAGAQNMTLPWRNAMTTTPTVLAVKYNDYMICRNGSYPTISGVTQNVSNVISLTSANWTYCKVNLNPASTQYTLGQVIWWSPTFTHLQSETITFGGFDPTAQVLFEVSKETQNIWGYSTKDADGGKFIWETNSVNAQQQQDITPLDYFGEPFYPYFATQPAYGNVYGIAYGGILYCYNLTTGIRTWSNGNGHTPGNNTDTGTSVPGYFPQLLNAVGNGVIYTVASQHTTITPISKGQMARAINATDGTEIWQISDYTGEFSTYSYAMADGYCNWFNGYDNQIYTVGRGPSATTVTAPDLAAASGQPVVIKGTVYDTSAGSQQTEQAADFPNGLPCATDSSMTDWMGYVYQQKPLPTNFTGVTVSINVVDANGNYRSIGTATTDATGAYSLIWTPNIPGSYQVTANFAGTQGYWPSTATTAFTVMEAPAATATPTPTPTSVADMYFVPAIAGLFVLIIIVGVVIILMLRKRP
jgi:hypothetical protein